MQNRGLFCRQMRFSLGINKKARQGIYTALSTKMKKPTLYCFRENVCFFYTPEVDGLKKDGIRECRKSVIVGQSDQWSHYSCNGPESSFTGEKERERPFCLSLRQKEINQNTKNIRGEISYFLSSPVHFQRPGAGNTDRNHYGPFAFSENYCQNKPDQHGDNITDAFERLK